MGVYYEKITPSLTAWVLNQSMFWVATAPLSGSGHVNVSPKGGKYFGITSPTQFWYLDLTGSGSETLAHINEPGNGRITISFNAFDGPPKIVRLWGKGEVLEYGSTEFKAFVDEHNVEVIAGTRAIVLVNFHQVGSSCGWSVPKYEFVEYRTQLNDYSVKKVQNDVEGNEADGMERYWAFKNAYSVDGLPAMKRGLATAEVYSVKPVRKMIGPYVELATRSMSQGRTIPAISLSLAIVLSFCMGIMATLVLQSELGSRNT